MEFSGSPLRGLYARNRVYEGVIGMDSFAPWLERLERQISERVLAELSEEIPPAWYEDDYDAMVRLLEQVYRRKQRVRSFYSRRRSRTGCRLHTGERRSCSVIRKEPRRRATK